MKNKIGSQQHHPASMADLKTVTDIKATDNPFATVDNVIKLLGPSATQRPSKSTLIPLKASKNNNLDGLEGEMSELIRMVAEIRYLDDITPTGTTTNAKTENAQEVVLEKLQEYLKENEDNIAKYLDEKNNYTNIEKLFNIGFSEWNDFLKGLSKDKAQPKLNQTSTGIDFTIQVGNKETTLFTTNTEQKGGGFKTGYNIPQLKTPKLIRASIKAVIVSHQSISEAGTTLKINLENFDQDSILRNNTILVDAKSTLDPEAIEKHRDTLQIELTQLKTFVAHHHGEEIPTQELSNIEEVEAKIVSIMELSGLDSYRPMAEAVSPEELYTDNCELFAKHAEADNYVDAKVALTKMIDLLTTNPRLDADKSVDDLKENLVELEQNISHNFQPETNPELKP